MAFEIKRSLEVLERTPGVLRAMLGGLTDFWTLQNYGPETFSPFDVVGHLIEGERHDWMVRARMILEHGDAQPFPAFDRYAMYQSSRNKSMGDLLEEFSLLRASNLDELRRLDLHAGVLETPGLHPELGGVTLRQLLATWVVHDLGHTHQIAKAMAYQYRHEVGPWTKFLTILPGE